MIRPALQDEAFLADVATARTAATPKCLLVWWLGQSGFLVGYEGEFLLFDPYLSDSLTKKYAATNKPHIRMTERVVDPERLEFVNVVTSSHNHTDHFDAETLKSILGAAPSAKLVLPAANVEFAFQRLGLAAHERLIPLADGQRVMLGAFTFEAVPAAHEELAPQFAGFVVSVGPFRLYHSGDTVRFPGMVERLRPFAVDLALLPINGRSPERRVAGNLDGAEAARLARDIDSGWVIPCHFEMFEFNTASPVSFAQHCQQLGQNYKILKAGERWELPR